MKIKHLLHILFLILFISNIFCNDSFANKVGNHYEKLQFAKYLLYKKPNNAEELKQLFYVDFGEYCQEGYIVVDKIELNSKLYSEIECKYSEEVIFKVVINSTTWRIHYISFHYNDPKNLQEYAKYLDQKSDKYLMVFDGGEIKLYIGGELMKNKMCYGTTTSELPRCFIFVTKYEMGFFTYDYLNDLSAQ